MQIKLNNHYFDIKITDYDPHDPEYVVWEFVDDGAAAIADALDLYGHPDMIAAFESAVDARRKEQQEDIAADRYLGEGEP